MNRLVIESTLHIRKHTYASLLFACTRFYCGIAFRSNMQLRCKTIHVQTQAHLRPNMLMPIAHTVFRWVFLVSNTLLYSPNGISISASSKKHEYNFCLLFRTYLYCIRKEIQIEISGLLVGLMQNRRRRKKEEEAERRKIGETR